MSNTWIPERAMVIYAHPDDIEFTVAGTAAKWARHGCQVVYVVLTDGNAGSHEAGMTADALARIRRAEQQAAADVTGATCVFVGEPDCLLAPTLELRKKVVRLIRQYRPQAVICGDPRPFFYVDRYINHPDHRAAAQVALEAVFPAAELNLLYPDLLKEGLVGHKVNYVYITSPQDANCYIDVADSIDLKVAALRQHVSQLGDWDPESRIKERAAEIGRKVGFEYAEAFIRITLHEPETEDT
ncbi:MAG: PIG-L family deacetylase [Anaerolineae bacterium]|nr:PIG-L family deacetylase [Anaerolineae bacterium]